MGNIVCGKCGIFCNVDALSYRSFDCYRKTRMFVENSIRYYKKQNVSINEESGILENRDINGKMTGPSD